MAENIHAARSGGGIANHGTKGHINENIGPGETITLLEASGSGLITRMFITLLRRTPLLLRSLRLDIFWDGAPQPAVSAPLGDFFCAPLGRAVAFESELFSNPEGRSFNCFIPMPFRTSARVTVTNESDVECTYFVFDLSLLLDVPHDDSMLYFHARWRRESPTTLGEDFDILPRTEGVGRFLGCCCGVMADPCYDGLWWGEGQIKVRLDGDAAFPTICGTGTEDYIGTAWGMDAFFHYRQGCLLADAKEGQWAFYRWHTADPVLFETDIRVSVQILGGAPLQDVQRVQRAGAPLTPVYLDDHGTIVRLLDVGPGPLAENADRDDVGCVFFRQDDWCATSYFYLDRTHIAPPELRSDATTQEGPPVP